MKLKELLKKSPNRKVNWITIIIIIFGLFLAWEIYTLFTLAIKTVLK